MQYEHLLGREWVHGSQDCFALARAIYAENWGIAFQPYAYPENWWSEAPELDLFMRHFQTERFVPLAIDNHFDMHQGDVLLIARGTRIASHCGVWVGGNRFVHHPWMGLSTVERWAGRWAGMTLAVLRHPDVPPPRPATKIDIIDLMPAHQRERYRELLNRRATQRLP
jgi:cell wall-associated NlpC family hydrolase